MAKSAPVKYEVRWRQTGTVQWGPISSIDPTAEIVVEALDRTKSYDFEVRAVSSCGARSAWVSSSQTVADVAPGTIVLSDLKTEVDNAAADAAAANAELANIASDNVLSQGEKPVVIRDYNVISTEQAGIDAQASSFGITTEKTAYDNAVTALTSYLGTLTSPTTWNNLAGDTTIVGTTFRSKFADVYTTRQALLNAIYAAAKVRADNAQSSATSAASAAAAAQADATSSLSQLADIASDGKLTADEKVRAKQNYLTVTGEQGGIDGQATAYSITTEKAAYDNAITTLKSYLQGTVGVLDASFNWTGITGTTAITRSTWDSNWTSVYTTRQTLLNAIYAAAKAKADAAQSSANTATGQVTQLPVINGGFDIAPTGYGWAADSGSGWFTDTTGVTPGVGTNCARHTGGVGASTGAYRNNGLAACQPGQVYKTQALIKAVGANGAAYVYISWCDASGAEIGTTFGNGVTGTTTAGSYAVGTAPAGTVYARTCLAVTSHTSGYYAIDNVVCTQYPSTIDEVPDGTTNARTLATRVNGGKPVIDFSEGIHFNKQLDNIADGSTYYRMPAANMDGSRRALIDFTQSTHLGKVLDNIGDGTTYGRPLGSRLNAGNPLIDFAAGYHLNKNIDNLADGSVYGRLRAGQLSSGVLALLGTGRNPIQNPQFTQNVFGQTANAYVASGVLVDNWRTVSGTGTYATTFWTGSGITCRVLQNFAIAASGATIGPRIVCGNFAVVGSATFAFKINRSSYQAGAAPAGVTAYHRVILTFYDATGAALANNTYDAAFGSVAPVTVTGTVPATAVTAVVNLFIYFQNTGAATTWPNTAIDATLNSVEYVQAANIDNEVIDGSTYGRPVLTRLSSGKPVIDFSEGIHFNKQLDNIADGSTYYRMPAANMDGSRRALIDFTQSTHLGKVLDNIGDGTTYGRPVLSRLSSGVPFIDFAAGIHLNKNIDNVADGTTFARVSTNALTSGNIDFAKSGFANKTVDNVGDGTTYARIKGTELSSGVHKLTVAGSGTRIGDQRNLLQRTITNTPAKVPTTISYSAAAGSPATATISVAAFTVLAGSVSTAYNAMSVGVTGIGGTAVTYYLYCDDPSFAGGTQTLVATTNGNDCYAGDGRVYIGSISVTFPTSGSGSGSGGGGGTCVSVRSWVITRRRGVIRAGDVRVGDELRIVDPVTGAERWGQVSYSKPFQAECMTVRTASGTSLTCSETAPLGTARGQVVAPDAEGHRLAERVGEVFGHGRCVRVSPAGLRWVQHITCEDDFFLAGDDPNGLLAHHNLKP